MRNDRVPEWHNQLKICELILLEVQYQYGVASWDNVVSVIREKRFPEHVWRLAAMCAQVCKNGRPLQFFDAYFEDE